MKGSEASLWVWLHLRVMLILSPSQNKAEAYLGSPKTSSLHMDFKEKGGKNDLSREQEKSARHLRPARLCTQV